ncbi:hypothetical protein SAMN02745171_00147 [Porphyromonas circumdentaria]|uniref:Uncharacterized protein n=1 Tax=Porphyromonas circumdentaria TaxID=29524 RepID=A0A1T4KQG3_9PORP|nr:hypothetical protein [Porphyromonas circumdentaria]SJZ44679.1 hypothetical protein SAMN02745171_00147 [Porphyromonas circumdentaria]
MYMQPENIYMQSANREFLRSKTVFVGVLLIFLLEALRLYTFFDVLLLPLFSLSTLLAKNTTTIGLVIETLL